MLGGRDVLGGRDMLGEALEGGSRGGYAHCKHT